MLRYTLFAERLTERLAEQKGQQVNRGPPAYSYRLFFVHIDSYDHALDCSLALQLIAAGAAYINMLVRHNADLFATASRCTGQAAQKK